MIELGEIDFTNFENAINTLEEALSKNKINDLERDGVIQRFEYTFELSWKLVRKILVAFGRSVVSSSPKPILRSALEEGFIDDVGKWFAFLEARNMSTHIYSEKESEKVFNAAKEFLPEAKKLLKRLSDVE